MSTVFRVLTDMNYSIKQEKKKTHNKNSYSERRSDKQAIFTS
jgi:hypothetical protein